MKESSGMYEDTVQLHACRRSGFVVEEGPYRTPYLLNSPWLLIARTGFMNKRCVEGSR